MIKKHLRFISAASTIAILDQITKYLVVKLQPTGDGGFFQISFIKNTGAGFGILPGQNSLLAIISTIVAMAIMFYYLKSPPELQQEKKIYLLYAVLLGGIIGNLIDRLVYGYVIDFLHFSFWPAFNIADTSISLSIIGLIYYYWKEK